jgi:DNA-binding response OmpR family regulator
MPLGQKVLYIDDESLLKMAFVETLKQQGYDAKGAISGKEALEMVEAEVPDIIILDIMMKPMDGWETLTRIRERDSSKTVPVIMQTGKSLTIKDFIKYGDQIEDYLIKPVRLPDLVKAIEGVWERKSMLLAELEKARENGGDTEQIDEYLHLRKRTIICRRLIEILGRIYPIQFNDVKIESDFDLPELHEVINRYETEKRRCKELRSILFGSDTMSEN